MPSALPTRRLYNDDGRLGSTASSASTSSPASIADDSTRCVHRPRPRRPNPAQEATVDEVVQGAITQHHLRSAIVRVTMNGKEIIAKAYGESMTGVPATTDMHFRATVPSRSPMSQRFSCNSSTRTKVSLDDKVSQVGPREPAQR